MRTSQSDRASNRCVCLCVDSEIAIKFIIYPVVVFGFRCDRGSSADGCRQTSPNVMSDSFLSRRFCSFHFHSPKRVEHIIIGHGSRWYFGMLWRTAREFHMHFFFGPLVVSRFVCVCDGDAPERERGTHENAREINDGGEEADERASGGKILLIYSRAYSSNAFRRGQKVSQRVIRLFPRDNHTTVQTVSRRSMRTMKIASPIVFRA